MKEILMFLRGIFTIAMIMFITLFMLLFIAGGCAKGVLVMLGVTIVFSAFLWFSEPKNKE